MKNNLEIKKNHQKRKEEVYDYGPLNPALITYILLQPKPFPFVQSTERRGESPS